MLIEYKGNSINLKYVECIRIQQLCKNEFYLKIQFNSGEELSYECSSSAEANKVYKALTNLIKTSTNLDIDSNGVFICSHCGAPNT